MFFIETSALSGNNVEAAFQKVGFTILEKIEKKVIDVQIEEFGVKQAGKNLLEDNNRGNLRKATRTRQKKKGDCNC